MNKPITAERRAELARLHAAATPEWMQALHIDEPRALVSRLRPRASLLALDSDDMAIFDRAEDCAVAVAAVNALPLLLADLAALEAALADVFRDDDEDLDFEATRALPPDQHLLIIGPITKLPYGCCTAAEAYPAIGRLPTGTTFRRVDVARCMQCSGILRRVAEMNR